MVSTRPTSSAEPVSTNNMCSQKMAHQHPWWQNDGERCLNIISCNLLVQGPWLWHGRWCLSAISRPLMTRQWRGVLTSLVIVHCLCEEVNCSAAWMMLPLACGKAHQLTCTQPTKNQAMLPTRPHCPCRPRDPTTLMYVVTLGGSPPPPNPKFVLA